MTRHELSPLEVASGLVFGLLPAAEAAPAAGPPEDPLEALEAAVRPALERSPCVVSFSGGRDSSAVLAVATQVARREGLPLPKLVQPYQALGGVQGFLDAVLDQCPGSIVAIGRELIGSATDLSEIRKRAADSDKRPYNPNPESIPTSKKIPSK